MTMKFVWWNTSLSPPRGTKEPSYEEYIIARDVINYFDNVMEADVFALCEVDEADVDLLYGAGNLSEYGVVYDFESIGNGSYFDIAFFYRKSLFESPSTDKHVSGRIARRLKLALEVSLQSKCLGKEITFFLSHWPSRLNRHAQDAASHQYGDRLKSVVDMKLVDGDCIRPILLMGDYNDEPFDASLADNLFATRDFQLVRKKGRHLLYNSFWKDTGYRVDGCGTVGGSYYYSSGETSKWHTFDQIIFSSYFLADKDGWAVNRGMTKVFAPLRMLPSVLDRKLRFDHLPVMSFVERV